MRSGILEVVDKEADGLMPTGTRVCSLSRHRGVHHREGDRGFNGGITRRVTPALALALSALLVLAPAALAAAGGGSSGFGGGGGGGGGSSGSGDDGGGGVLLFGLIAVGFIAFLLVGAIGRARYRRERRRRVERVRAAAAEAAEDDAYLAADAVGEGAAKLFMSCQEAWDARDRERLAELVGEDLLVEWRRRLDDFERKGWHNRVEVIAGPEVEYVGLVNREDDSQDRVVVRIEATLEDYVEDRRGRRITRTDSWDTITTRAEYWTLARRGDAWIVVSIEQQAEGDHHLEDEIVAVPWGDAQLRDDTLVEQAAADKTLDGYKIAELADFELADDARAQALDLSLADGRFAPVVLEATARRAVAAWAEAVDGADAALEQVATPDAVRMLLHPGGERTRVVVRGPRVDRLRLVRLDAAAEPATMTVEVDVRGRRYREDRDTAAVISGSQSRESRFTERWTLALDGSDETPWRIVDGAAGAATV